MTNENTTPMSWRVIDLLAEKVASLIGDDDARLLDTVRAADHENDPSPELV